MFSEYLNHGWKLCRIQPGSKGPRAKGWNNLENAVRDASDLKAAGLLHAYSGTCALDIDDLAAAKKFLQERGIDLNLLLKAPDAVQIVSGNPNHAKLLYRLAEPLPSKSFANGAFELRCATGTGKSAQDVLPPSPHPNGTTYRWEGDWRNLPALPDALKTLWQAEIATENVNPEFTNPTGNLLELAAILSTRNPDCGYEEWCKIGMVCHYESNGSEAGLALWDEFSSPSDKYPGFAALRSKWASFGRSETPATIDSLRKNEIATADEFDVVGDPVDFTAPEKPKLSYRALDLDELFSRPTPDWLIPGILPQKGIGSFWGQPGSGKTFLAVDIALSVALGQKWRGKDTRQGKIYYVAAEDDYGVQARLFAGLACRGATRAPVRVLPAAPNFTSSAESKALLEAITAEGPIAITFVDTLARVTTGADENTAKDMNHVIDLCNRIYKITNGLVILIHHSGKDQTKGIRGSSVLHGAFDVEWEVTEQEHCREMKISKMKNAPTGNKYNFQLIPVGDSCAVEWI